ncbi:MAG: multidrug DMT transporter, partial [Acinetobacter sp.]
SDLAVIRKQVRKDIQAAINAEREITQEQAKQSNIDPALQVAQYKTLANDVHEQIQALIETRPPIRNTPILLLCTSQWLAHQLYGDMN